MKLVDSRPSLLLLGDSRSRWMLMIMAKSACNPRLDIKFDARIPRAFNTSAQLNAALDGDSNWRSGGGFMCIDTKPRFSLQAVNSSVDPGSME